MMRTDKQAKPFRKRKEQIGAANTTILVKKRARM